MNKVVLIFLSILMLTSCSVQKRRYQKGFYVSRSHQKETKALPSLADKQRKNQAKPVLVQEVRTGDRQVEASANGASPIFVPKKTVPPDTCDILMFQDGSEAQVKVVEVNPTDIKYKRCDNLSGPVYVTRKSDLFMIKYSNGSREVIKTEKTPEQNFPTYKQRDYSKPKVNHPRAPLALGLGVAAMFAGFLTLVMAAAVIIPPIIIVPLLLLAIAAVVVSSNVINQIKERPEVYKGKGMAVTGLVFGIIMLSIYAITALLILLFFLI